MKLMFVSLVALFSASAFANDGGVVGVSVEDLKVEKVVYEEEQETRTPVALTDSERIEATFKGGNVAEMMKWLPGGRSVTKGYSKHVRSLAIAAKEGYVYINCADADLSSDKKGDVWTPKEPSCTVTLSKYETPVSEEWSKELFGDWQDLDVPNSCKMK